MVALYHLAVRLTVQVVPASISMHEAQARELVAQLVCLNGKALPSILCQHLTYCNQIAIVLRFPVRIFRVGLDDLEGHTLVRDDAVVPVVGEVLMEGHSVDYLVGIMRHDPGPPAWP